MGFWDDVFRDAYVSNPALNNGQVLSQKDYTNLGKGTFGFAMPTQIDPNAPGGSLDTSAANAQRDQLEQLINSLQQQAATGNGAWQQTLANAIQNAQSNASAVGQGQVNQRGGNAGSALRDIGNAQSAASQMGVRQGDVLRTESKQNAQDELGQLESSVGSGDISQATNAAAVGQEQRQANAALLGQYQQDASSIIGGSGQAVGTIAAVAASSGGRVPGQPQVFGDNERNDTVPAMLSPGEIVVPRSKASDPQAAARFAAAIARRHGRRDFPTAATDQAPRHLAGGGSSDPFDPGTPSPGPGLTYGSSGPIGINGPEAPSIQNGGLLDTSAYESTRGAMDTLSGQLMDRAAGGSSVADTIGKQQQDTAIQEALQVQNQAAATKEAALGGAKVAGEAGQKRLSDQTKGENSAANFIEQRRAQEQALAEARQRAAMGNTELNAGLNLNNQQLLRNYIAGAGQATVGLASAGYGGAGTPSAPPMVQADTGFTPTDYSSPDQGESRAFGASDAGMARGGVIGYAGGGDVRFADALQGAAGSLSHALRRTSNVMVPQPPPKEAPKTLRAEKVWAPGDVDVSELSIQRARGGSIPGYAFGPGPVGEQFGPVDFNAPPPAADADTSVPFANPAAEQGYLRNKEATAVSRGVIDVAKERGLDAAKMDLTDPGNYAVSQQAQADERGKLTSLGPRPPAATELPEKPPTKAPPARTGGGAPAEVTGLRDLEEGSAEQRTQMGVEAEAAANIERLKGVAAEERAKVREKYARDEADTRERAKLAQSEMMSKSQAVIDEMKRIDGTVDPGRFWASRSMPQKIAGAIGLALGSFSNDGINRAAQILGQNIDRDIDAQKAEHAFRLQKGEKALQGLQTMYAQQHEIFKDELSATAAAKVSATDIVADRMEAEAAKYSSADARAKILAAAAQLKHANGTAKAELINKSSDTAYKKAETAKAYADAARPPGGGSDLQNQQAGALTALDTIKSIRAKLSATRVAGGAAPLGTQTLATGALQKVGPLAAGLAGDTANLMTQLKDAEKLGAISSGDYELLKAQIGDPADFWTSEGSKDAKLDALEGRVKTALNNRRAAAGLNPIEFQ